MNGSIKVSIIIPVYGVEKYIEKCARSLFEQTYSNIEYIFVNDKSKDDSIDILKKVLTAYPDRKAQVRIVEHEKNKGLSQARETGIGYASGMYLMHVDSDDYIEPNMVELCVDKVLRTNCDMVICGFWDEYASHRVANCSSCQPCDKCFYLSHIITQDFLCSIWGKLIRTSLYKSNDIHCIPEISFAEDYAVLPRLLWYCKKIEFLSKPLYYYTHFNNTSLTNNFKMKDVYDKVIAQKCIDVFFAEKIAYKEEIQIANLKRKAWAIRAMLINGYKMKDINSFFDNYQYKLSLFKNFSINHNIILLLNNINCILLLKMYCRLTKCIKR